MEKRAEKSVAAKRHENAQRQATCAPSQNGKSINFGYVTIHCLTLIPDYASNAAGILMNSTSSRRFWDRGTLLFLALMMGSCVTCLGVDSTWNGAVGSDGWNLATGWTAGVPQAGDAAIFGPSTGKSTTPTLTQSTAVGMLRFPTGAGNYTIKAAPNAVLTLNASSGLSAYTGIWISQGDQTITAPLELANNQAWLIGSGTTLGVSSEISGIGALYKYQPGTLVLSGPNTYAGDTWIRAGTLVLAGNAPNDAPGVLGQNSNPVYLGDDGTAKILIQGGYTMGRSISLAANVAAATLGVSTADTATFSGNIALNKNVTLTAASGGNAIFSGIFSGSGGMTNSGAGTVTLTGHNTFSGDVTLSSGTMVLSRPDALGTGTSAVNIGDGAGGSQSLLLGSGVTLSRDIAVPAGSGTATIGGANDANSTFSGNITLKKGLTITQAATTGANKLTISGGITASGTSLRTLTVDNAGTVAVTSALNDNGSAKIALIKQNGGTLLLQAVNGYTGGTTLRAGHLALMANNTLGGATGGLTLEGGVLDANSCSLNLGALSLAGNSSIVLGNTSQHGTLRFSSATWTAGDLSIEGWQGSTTAGTDDRIYIDTAPSVAFLQHVSMPGYGAVTWDSNTHELLGGQPVPEPALCALLCFGSVFGGHRLFRYLRRK